MYPLRNLQREPHLFEQFSTDERACANGSNEKLWQLTAVQNLVRYAPSSTYFAHFRVGGKLVWKSLKTATFSVAKQRLPDTLRDHRSKIESLTAFAEGKMTVGNAPDVYVQKVRASISLKPRSKDYRELNDRLHSPFLAVAFRDRRAQGISARFANFWLSRYQQRYSPSVINKSIGTLRAIFGEAIRLRRAIQESRCRALAGKDSAETTRASVPRRVLEICGCNPQCRRKRVEGLRKPCLLSRLYRTENRRRKARHLGRRELRAPPIARARRPGNCHKERRNALCHDDFGA